MKKTIIALAAAFLCLGFASCEKVEFLTDPTTGYISEVNGVDVPAFIENKYPGARIIETDYDDGKVEIDIIHDSREKNVYLNKSGEWLYTEWDVLTTELPDAVLSTVRSNYSDYVIEDIDYVESPTQDHYKIDLEKGNKDRIVRITAAGNII